MRSTRLVTIFEATLARLRGGAPYAWTHMGACNCGHLVQTVTGLAPEAIRRIAYEKPGEWAEQARDYCPGSGLPVDDVFATLVGLGITTDEIADLERLSDPRVVARMALSTAEIDHRRREHLIAYLEAWKSLVEEELARAAEARARAA
jgi:hypothetical protein